jgi:activating signal cointegrator 1
MRSTTYGPMRALTLTQPWASLVARGAKRVETRSWSTAYRGPVAIHAAKGLPPVRRGGRLEVGEFAVTRDAEGLLLHAPQWAIDVAGAWDAWPYRLPLGAVVATAELVEVRPAELAKVVEPELSLGNYAPGRFAWLLDDVVPLRVPVPAKGALGLWTWGGLR